LAVAFGMTGAGAMTMASAASRDGRRARQQPPRPAPVSQDEELPDQHARKHDDAKH
jgi:hypothetical protein